MTQEIYLNRTTPETQGIASTAILAFVEAAGKNIDNLHSLMLLRHGQVVAEGWWSPYGPDHLHMLYSLSKSFASSAIGLAVAEGRLSVDDPVLSFFPEEAPAEASQNLAAMRVRHLLSMSTGHVEDTTGRLREAPDGNWVKAFLACPVEREPGSHFLYNSGATYMLSAIVQKLTGLTLLDYLRPRLLDPLGIKTATWESCPRGINTGGWGLSIKTEDIARFGQMYLQKGVWQGKRILSEAWVEEATARQVSNGSKEDSDWEQGYGYQFWRCRHGAYRGDGAFGQYCLVMPAQDAVLAITAGVKDMQAVLNLVWEYLLPAMDPTPLPENSQAQAELERKLAGLALVPPSGAPTSPVAARVSGRKYHFEPNELQVEWAVLDFTETGCCFMVRAGGSEHQVKSGGSGWLKGITTLDSPGPRPVVAWGAWPAEDTYVIQLCFYETPACPTLTCRFVEDWLLVDYKRNVSFGPTEFPQLVGQLRETQD